MCGFAIELLELQSNSLSVCQSPTEALYQIHVCSFIFFSLKGVSKIFKFQVSQV